MKKETTFKMTKEQKREIKRKQKEIKNYPNEKEQTLKNTIKLTYKVFKWISIFLLLPTITTYIIDWPIIKIARDIGIIITTIWLIKINKSIKKKEKEKKEV